MLASDRLLFARLKTRIQTSLATSRIPFDVWRDHEGKLSSSEQRQLRVRVALTRVVRVSRWLARLPIQTVRVPYHWLELAAELERLHFSQWRRVDKGRGCVVDRQTWLINGHNIRLGDFVKISAFSSVMAGEIATITIGSNTIVGPGCTIVAINHGFEQSDMPIRYQPWIDRTEGSIAIADDVWLGSNVVVLPGAKIGRGAVVGAGSVIEGEVLPYTVTSSPREQTSELRRGVSSSR